MGLFHHSSEKSGPPPDNPNAQPAPPPTYPGNGDAPLEKQPGLGQGSTSRMYDAPPSIFAALLLARTDRIRIIGFPPEVKEPLGEAIAKAWPVGIQKAEPFDATSFEWKLKGNPWAASGSEAVPSRRLVIHVLHCLASLGWHLHTSCDLSKKEFDKDSLLFRAGPQVSRIFCSISFNEYDKIRLIDWPNEQVKEAFIAAVRTWPRGIQDWKEKEPQCYQMKLKGNPWITSNGTEVNATRALACQILSAMDHQGFELVGSVDMSQGYAAGAAGSGAGQDLDTWFFGNKM